MVTPGLMGFFSWNCIGCGHPLLSRHATGVVNAWMELGVVITPRRHVIRGVYDGYGRLLGWDEAFPKVWEEAQDVARFMGPGGEGRASVFHEDCWQALGRPGYVGGSARAEDQGFFFDNGCLGPHALCSPLGQQTHDAPRARLARARVGELVRRYRPRSEHLDLVEGRWVAATGSSQST